MSRFLQIHALTFHAPSNINRDDTGRPKTAVIGGVERLRISSQAIKRAIRTSEAFRQAMDGHLSARTQRLGDDMLAELVHAGVAENKALAAARQVAEVFGKLAVASPENGKAKPAKGRKKVVAAEQPVDETADAPGEAEPDKKRAWIAQLAFISPTERAAALALARRIAAGETIDPKKETPLLHVDTAVDIAMFGRMLADAPHFNREAAVQVAHAFTTHRTPVESDYYTAMDDEKPDTEDVGAGFIGATGFGSGVYYFYVAIDAALLTKNLGGDADLAARAVEAFAQAFATVTPSGKINSFANHGRPSFILAEKGDQQPRTLAGAFLRPIADEDVMAGSVAELKKLREAMDKAYGVCADEFRVMDLAAGDGSLAQIVAFLKEGVGHG